MNFKYILLGLSVICITIVVSCSGRKEKDKYVEDVVTSDVPQEYLFDQETCASISIFIGVGIPLTFLDETDMKLVLEYINLVEYNEEYSENNIQYKIAEPDYILVVTSKTGEESVLKLWVNQSLILLCDNAKWYTPLSTTNIKPILEKYVHNS